MAKPKSMPVKKRRVFLVEDHALVREGIAERVNLEPDLTICGQAASTEEALPLIQKKMPDVVIVDISLPGRDGLELTKDLIALDARQRILVISMHDEMTYTTRALRAGAMGFVPKHASPEALVTALRQVLNDEFALSQKFTTEMLESLSSKAKPKPTAPVEKLSDREMEVLRLMGEDRSTKEIAAVLHLSVKTVDSHRSRIRRKLRIGDNARMKLKAIELTQPPSPLGG